MLVREILTTLKLFYFLPQMAEISQLTKKIESLEKYQIPAKSGQSGQFSFIIKDLQMQVQHLEDKSSKKDGLIKKLAEVLLTTPNIVTGAVVATIREATFKPSDRKIDFNIQTLCAFLEKWNMTVASHGQTMRARQ